MAEIKEILSTAQTKMQKTIEVLRVDLASVRAGRASVSLLDKDACKPGCQRNRAGTAHDCYSAMGEKSFERY